MSRKLQFALRALRSKLWIKPLGYALLAIGAVFVARLADGLDTEGLLQPSVRHMRS